MDQGKIRFADALGAFIERSRHQVPRLGLPETSRDELIAGFEHALEELSVAEKELRSQTEELDRVSGVLQGERERYRELFDAAPDAYIVTDGQGTIIELNRAASRMLGLAPAFAVGKPLPVFLPESERRSFRAQVAALARLERMKEWEVSVLHREGSSTPVSIGAAGTVNPITGQLEIRWLLRDVTERRRAEHAARTLQFEQAARMASEASERRALFLADVSRRLAATVRVDETLRLIPELAVPVLGAYCIVDRIQGDGRIERFVGRHVQVAGQDIVTRLLQYPPDPEDRHGVARVLRTGRSEVAYPGETEPRSSHESALLEALRPRLELIVAIRGRHSVFGALTIGVVDPPTADLNPVLMAEEFAQRAATALEHAILFEAAEAARAVAERANEAKARFLAALSHELRTPLSAALGYSELLLEGVPERLPDALVPFVRGIRASIRHQLSMMEDLLLFTSAEEGHLQLRPELVDLGDVVREVVSLVTPDADAAKINVQTDIPGHPVVTFIDRGKVRQVLVNLVTNALRFTERGEIGVGLSAADGHARLNVWDTGVGIPEDHLSHIFDRFWRSDSVRGRKGFGLGLTITRQLLQLLDGEMKVESEVGAGTRFNIVLPIRSVADGTSDHDGQLS